jgi:PTH1 family peptidyl-tRNA hydrolase
VGLGNPGLKYRFTRHNAGFMVLDRVALDGALTFESIGSWGLICRGDIEGVGFCLLKPQTYMNRSGVAVSALMEQWQIPINKVFVISDDFNLPLGRVRIRKKGSDGGHRGLQSIIETLGDDAFPRLRIGVGDLPEDRDPADFVLEEFADRELAVLKDVLVRAGDALHAWLTTDDLDLCMNKYNVDPGDPSEDQA